MDAGIKGGGSMSTCLPAPENTVGVGGGSDSQIIS